MRLETNKIVNKCNTATAEKENWDGRAQIKLFFGYEDAPAIYFGDKNETGKRRR